MKGLDRAERLFQDNTRLAYWAISRYYPALITDDDIKQEALIGLWKACNGYDESKSAFATYAVKCIISQIAMALRKRTRWAKLNTVSLEESLSGDGELTLEDLVPDPNGSIEDSGIFFEEFIRTLNDRDRTALWHRMKGLKQKEAAREMGITQSYYSRIMQDVQAKYMSFAYGSGGGRIAQ